MSDMTTLAVAVLPFAGLALASISKSFRLVLKAVFSSGDTSSVVSTQSTRAARASSQAAEARDLAAAAVVGSREELLAVREILAARLMRSHTDAVAKISVTDEALVITIPGDQAAVSSDRVSTSHAGKHARGSVLTGNAE